MANLNIKYSYLEKDKHMNLELGANEKENKTS